MSLKQLQRHAAEIKNFVASGDYVATDGGILIHGDIHWSGRFIDAETGETLGENLITTAGMNYLLDAAIGADPVTTTWYQALSASGTPDIAWTANSYATSFENKSQTEGYSGANRPTYTPGQTSGGVLSNVGSEAQFNIVTASSVNFVGAAIVSSQARGATSGVLLAASNFASARTFSNGDVWKFAYECKVYN